MSVTLYNEGRVVGLSAYEAFVRLFLADPNNTGKQPPDEKEWLSSSIASGSSMLVKVPQKTQIGGQDIADDQYHVIDILLPNDTTLCAANTITAALAEVEVDVQDPYEVGSIGAYSGSGVVPYRTVSIADNIDHVEFSASLTTAELENIRFIPNPDPDDPDNGVKFGLSNYIGEIDGTAINDSGALMWINWASKTNVVRILNYNTTPIQYADIKIHYAAPVRVASYNNQLSPNKPGLGMHPENIPNHDVLPAWQYPTNLSDYHGPSQNEVARIENYLKIQDGVIIQDASWTLRGSGDMIPASAPEIYPYQPPVVRLLCKGPITSEFYLLLTGFTNATVISATSDLDSSMYSDHPQNGDFLGPAVYPWVNKIVFLVNGSVLRYTTPDVIRQLAGDLSYENNVYSLAQDKTIGVGTNYIEFNGLRLYISSEEPNDNDIPDGSIGIGWTASTPGV